MIVARVRSEDGFSLIELLVVVLLLGILAAISIPAYLSQTKRAEDAEAKSVVSSMHGAVKVYGMDNGDFGGADVPKLVAIEPTLNDYQGALQVTGGGNDFTVTVTSDSGTAFSLSETNGAQSRSCTAPGSGGCHSDGSW